jgi:carbamoyltransferase
VTVVLGLNEFFHDTAAALVVDGRIAALVEQERLDRRKHAAGFALMGGPPTEAIEWCLAEAGLEHRDVDVIAVSFDADGPRALRILGDLVRGNRRHASVRGTLRNRFSLHDPALDFVGGLTWGVRRRRRYLQALADRCGARLVTVNHHLAHAASAFYPSGFDDAAVVVLDGMGDVSPTTVWEGRGDQLRLGSMVQDPHESLGILYRTISLALGFSFMDAGKTMGLAAHGEPREPFLSMLRPAGRGYRIDWDVVRAIGEQHLGHRGELTDVHRDVAASLQHQLERVGVALARGAMELTGSRRICLAGGVALNCNMNSRILLEAGVDELYVQPGAMDMGCALGAALVAAQRSGDEPSREFSVYSGPGVDDGEVEAALKRHGLRYEKVEDPAAAAADMLARRHIVGWVQGPMEFGPRALGSRSIVANPDRLATRDRVNQLKKREAWRPLAPAVLEERLQEWMPRAVRSPYMTLTFDFLPEQARRVPAVVHEDGSARVQSVCAEDHPEYHALIARFEERTGLPVILNTSFNRRGEPIVCTPADAVDSFLGLGLDALVAGSFVARVSGGV